MIAEHKIAFFLPEETLASQDVKLTSNGFNSSANPRQGVSSDDPVSAEPSNGHAHRHYGRVSMTFSEVAEHGLRTPANENKGPLLKTYGLILKIAVPIILALGFLAWF